MPGAEGEHSPYKLTVIKSHNGDYRVNFYYKLSDQSRATLPEVIQFMSELANPCLSSEPTYMLPDQERVIIEAVRSGLLYRDRLNQRLPQNNISDDWGVASAPYFKRAAGEAGSDIL